MTQPSPSPTPSPPATRFVVLNHSFPRGHALSDHWDWMLETDDPEGRPTLATWSTRCGRLGVNSWNRVSARRLANHRRDYLDYEGPVSDGRGDVQRIAAGRCLWRICRADYVEVELVGSRLRGTLQLTLQADDAWELTLQSPAN